MYRNRANNISKARGKKQDREKYDITVICEVLILLVTSFITIRVQCVL